MDAGKRILAQTGFPFSLILLFLFLFQSSAGLTEEIPSWFSSLREAEGFEMQSDGNWVYQQTAEYLFTDGKAFFGLEAATYAKTGEVLICAFAGLADNRNQPLAEVTRFEVFIGEQTWSWHSPVIGRTASLVYLGESEKDFLEALETAERLDVQIHFLARKMIVSFERPELDRLCRASGFLHAALEAVDTGNGSITGTYESEHPVHRKGDRLLTEPANQPACGL